MALCLENDQLETVQRILNLHFEGLEVWAYGARVTGVDLTPETELDLAVIAERPLSFEAMTAVEKAFAESGLPFRVDIIDWVKIPESIQKQIKKEHDVVQAPAED
ncbi:MAG: nucleotidyltransferase domain-containing protein [Fibrobacter sp.]|nr:nucleotidyltransferase domain-containing protein [Fibrobacter sp.]